MLVRSIEGFGDLLGRYDYTASLLPSNWAWEFARRNQVLRDDAYAVLPQVKEWPAGHNIRLQALHEPDLTAEAWGLLYFPDPDQSALSADVFWSDPAFPERLLVHFRERAPYEIVDMFEDAIGLCRMVQLTDSSGRKHLRIKGANCSVQFRCAQQAILVTQPIKIEFSVPGFECPDTYVQAIRRARRVCDARPAAPTWSRKTLGYRNALIALDAHAADMNYRELAMIFYGKARVAEDWSGCSNAMKSGMARLLAKGQRLRDGGYRDLLRYHL